MKNFYEQDNIVVRRSKPSDIDALKDRLRKEDVHEIYASNHQTPESALRIGLEKSIWCATIENGRPLALFGVNPESVLGKRAIVWLLGSEDIDNIKRRFVRNSKKFLRIMLEFYPYLFNYVHADNKKSIQWIKWLGGVVEEPKKYGIEQENFCYFYFKK